MLAASPTGSRPGAALRSSGGTVQVLAASGAYNPRTTYAILTAAGGVSGQFAGITSNMAFLSRASGT